MVWQSTAPDGSKSVKANNTILQQNTTYTETTLNVDHYWNIGTNEDGHHKYVQMPETQTGGTPSDPTIAAGMDLVYYAKQKTSTESPAQQDVQPYALNSSDVMQVLGIRACCLLQLSPGFNLPFLIKYSHNIASFSRVSTGNYKFTFSNALPSANYLVLANGFPNSNTANALSVSLPPFSSTSALKNVNNVTIAAKNESGTSVDPLEVWMVCFGG